MAQVGWVMGPEPGPVSRFPWVPAVSHSCALEISVLSKCS